MRKIASTAIALSALMAAGALTTGAQANDRVTYRYGDGYGYRDNHRHYRHGHRHYRHYYYRYNDDYRWRRHHRHHHDHW